ncbi:protein phosphatase 2C domain-containing protein [Micromonospora phytophila]|uniref:PP2C family protein-serine/threonine phosphatase n=1 Tax=Micromonospora phytophila TaxID=709888 RepID=UPI00202E967B|nr:protein phosphatase 2C domain-containing protein [Micromonospora phytophila]MCM0673928.1 protein phosphatase 2C domain-containing protein [Micromonospora phytophila]
MTSKPGVHAASRTHVGLVRRRNEDSFYQGQWLYAVADGLGGHVAGDIASTTAIDAVKAYDRLVPAADLADVLGRAIHDVNDKLRQRIRQEPELAGMGTTMVAALWSGDTAVLANVGDSRAYLMRDFRATPSPLVRVSEDHIYRHLVSDAGDVPDLPEKLARFLDGRTDGRSPDLTVLQLRPGDRLLLCSDGLSSYVPPELIRSALNSADSPPHVADTLIAAALDHGGHDNVTVMVIDIADQALDDRR